MVNWAPTFAWTGTELVSHRFGVRVIAMKARDSTLRLKRFDVAEKARKVADLEIMARDFESMVLDLQRQIATEEERTGIRDPGHFAYSTFAKSVAVRRDKLVATIDDLKAKLDAARLEHDTASEELKRLEAAEGPGTSTISRGKQKPTGNEEPSGAPR